MEDVQILPLRLTLPPTAASRPLDEGPVDMLTTLKEQGLEFRQPRWLKLLGWTQASPAEAAELVLNDEPDDLQVLQAGKWQPLRDKQELQALHAFQTKTPERLPHPELAHHMESLTRLGFRFQVGEEKLEPWAAYSRLAQGQPLETDGPRRARLTSGQDVAMLAYLQGTAGLESLERPRVGEAARAFEEAGYLGDALEAYRSGAEELHLQHRGAPLGTWSVRQPLDLSAWRERQQHLDSVSQLISERPLEAALALEALPTDRRPAYLDWLRELQDPQAAAAVAALDPAGQDRVRDLLARTSNQLQPEGTWALRDGIWTDGPPGPYQPNQRAALSLPPLTLNNFQQVKMSFRASFDLESGYDSVQLQASQDGQSWETLRSFTGKRDWQDESLSLADYEGRTAHLRLLFSSDSSNQQEGFSLSGLKVEGVPRFGSQSQTLFDESPRAERARLAGELARALADGRPVEPLEQLVDACATPAEALSLWQAVLQNPAGTATLMELNREVGPAAAVALASRGIDLGTFRAALELAPEPGLEAALKVCDQLQPLSEPGRVALQALVERLSQAWQAEGHWARNPDGSWSDSPAGPYRPNQNASLTSPELSLAHLSEPVARFSVRHELEKGYDNVSLEASRDGQSWDHLTAFTGTSAWQAHEVSLKAYQGEAIRLRFRFQSDASNQAEGLDLKDFVVDAQPAYDSSTPRRVVFSDQPSSRRATLDRLLDLAKKGDTSTLQALVRLGGHPAQAFDLLPLGEDPALRELSAAIGTEAAVALWPEVGPGKATEAARAFELGRELSYTLAQPLRQETLLGLTRDLLKQGSVGELESLVGVAGGWEKSAWKRLPDGSWVDNLMGVYRPNEDSALTTRPISLAGQSSPIVSFECRHQLEQGYDRVELQVGRNGDWRTLESFTGQADWGKREVDLSSYADQTVQLRFRLTSDSSNCQEGFALRNLQVGEAFDDRPRALGEQFQGVLESLGQGRSLTALASAHGLPVALDLARLAPQDGPRRQALARLIELQGRTAGLKLWESMKDVPEERLAHEIELTTLAASFAPLGVEVEGLREAGLEPPALKALANLRDLLQAGGWQAEGEWCRSGPDGWRTSPHDTYRPSQNASLTSPPLLVNGPLTFQTDYELEQGYDGVFVEASSGAEGWQTVAQFTGEGRGPQKVGLSAYEGKTARLRFRLSSDASNQGRGLTFSDLRVGDGYREDGGRSAAQGLVALAADREVPAATRCAALTTLAGLPVNVGAAVLNRLGMRMAAGELTGAEATQLLSRLPAALVAEDVDAALDRILDAGPNSAIQDTKQAVIVGSVRVKKREEGPEQGPPPPG
ncbi:MAG: hypothetical protein AMXMBFR33_57700 [Candidatus Xenobia bacterium]